MKLGHPKHTDPLPDTEPAPSKTVAQARQHIGCRQSHAFSHHSPPRAIQSHGRGRPVNILALLFLCLTFIGCDQVEISWESNPSPTPSPTPTPPPTHGLDSDSETIRWTAYHTVEVHPLPRGDGIAIQAKTLTGKTKHFDISAEEARKVRMESAVQYQKGKTVSYAYPKKPHEWVELPTGAKGMGNHLNPLVPGRHVAADNRRYRYGSLVYFPAAKGQKFPGDEPMDGWFWVADSGGDVKANHMDLFIGGPAAYRAFVKGKLQGRHQTTIWPLPRPATGFDPRQPAELAALLVEAGELPAPQQANLKAVSNVLIKWQKKNAYIPAAEYGNPKGATTLWFLTLLGHDLAKKTD